MQRNANTKRRKRRWPVLVLALLVLCAALYLPVQGVVLRYLYPTEYTATVQRWAGEYNVDPNLVFAIIRTESGFDPEADSSAGARGLMQMTEDTFEWLKPRVAPGEVLVFEDLYDPDTSIRFGVYFYAQCLARYGGDISTAAAAYHSGWGTVDNLLADGKYSNEGENWLNSFPYAQMGHYVNKINRSYQKYVELYGG